MAPRPSRVESFRVVLDTASVASFVSTARGTALVVIEAGAAAFFAGGIAEQIAGPWGPWVLLGALLVGCALRAVDLESCALFIPGGLYGSVKQAYGRRATRLAATIVLADSTLFGALAASAAGHALAAVAGFLPFLPESPEHIAIDDLAITGAVCLTGAIWWWLRQGRAVPTRRMTRLVATGLLTLLGSTALGMLGISHAGRSAALATPPRVTDWRGAAGLLAAMAACFFAAGSTEALSRASSDFPQPRIRHLRRAAWSVSALSVLFTAVLAWLFVVVVPVDRRAAWNEASLAGIVAFAGPSWVSAVLVVAVGVTAALFLGLAIYRSAANAQQLLVRLSEDGLLPTSMRALHPRFGTPSRLIDLVAVVQLGAVLVTAGQVLWLAKTYAVVIGAAGLLKIAALVRLRTRRRESRAFRVPVNVRLGGAEMPVGLVAVAAAVAIPILTLMVSRDTAGVAGVSLIAAVTALFAISERVSRSAIAGSGEQAADVDLLPMPAVGFDQVAVRPGGLLVAVRKPGVLAHLGAALQAAGTRDVTVMTARLVGVDASEERAHAPVATDEERRLLNDAALLAERLGRAVHLVIVPAVNAFAAVAETAVRLRAAEIYVGESETLSADEQARRLGDAWERLPKPELLDVRLIIHHSSGRTAIYHLGAHAPALGADDFQLIHSLWLDLVKAVGPQVHHHDVVRAALKHMEQQLHDEGPPRDAVLETVRQVARPADALAAVVHQRDFARLRDMVRNRPASDLAAVFTDLSLEDQVVTFRVLPRKLAAAIFEYLSHDAQTALLKAMAQEDVAALLNNMAPDDRTAFLEELPASATQQLLALLTPQERGVAATLLGYPEHSIGRLMTPDYIAVREQWTVQQVLDYVRVHGHDSETLNVIYVVDDHGLLMDDIRIRELLLNALDKPISSLMDRRFVALNAADDQNAAVAIFRKEDRSALPVTDSTGVLIGIVTIDDVLDVAEAAATKEIQRIGGSEALDEPYMRIAFARMIQKRAGWLTALFLGEMLTATAMGAFEREIERAVVLALFVPLIISSGGNSGSQASTLVIRAIALGEVELKDWWRVMRREIGAGLALGCILGSIGFLRITLWSAFSTMYGEHWLLVALTVGMALIGVVLWGTLVGSLLPFLLRRLGFDPATSSAPFVATLVDVTGLIIYFSVGLLTLHGTLL